MRTITEYRFGHICVDDEAHDKDVVIYPDRVYGPWWRKEGHRLDADDLEAVFAARPRVLIVGTGYYGNMKVPEETRRSIESHGIELHVARTPEAVDLFNTMREAADVVAALHLTC
ncbi:MAG: hypothetical protein GWN84_21315 [Gammaproteobacteria bacterium]|nr:hypothetical protein [Gammaproteobacteria bacterium]NIR85262.1 hypothetical protein [Gammaproteobacteria bacterium]NIR88378.1 hypothetical protein [Gammaproteobacteria bacterium]NIU06328.1 hypothetical protein [Gammaproteobacteria bacterium]NIV53227.1 hypothetical protein [Gammaproteobacteria bacterium]